MALTSPFFFFYIAWLDGLRTEFTYDPFKFFSSIINLSLSFCIFLKCLLRS